MRLLIGCHCIAQGGIWGLAAATALESLPVEVRGLASGLLQEGYAGMPPAIVRTKLLKLITTCSRLLARRGHQLVPRSQRQPDMALALLDSRGHVVLWGSSTRHAP